jgi:predicted dehydrogenase
MAGGSVLRVGVMGTGAFAAECHIPGLQAHPRARVVAVCGRRLSAARDLASRFGVPDAYDDPAEMCARAGIDAVTIASAPVAHAAHALCALRAGKHVFCEKPLALDVPEARLMREEARRAGVVHQVAFTFRYNLGIRALRERIARGDIGEPFLARIQYDRWDGLHPGRVRTWRDDPSQAGGGILFDLGSHLFDIVRHVLGPLERVVGFTHRIDAGKGEAFGPGLGTDDLATAWMSLKSGVRAQFFASRITPPFAPLGYLEVIGTCGALKAALSRGGVDFLKASAPNAAEWTDVPLPGDPCDGNPRALGRMMGSFVDACLRGRTDPDLDADFEDGLAAQLAMDALLRSERSLRWEPADGSGDAC